LGKGGCVFGSSPKRLQRPHPQLVHWWLLVHFSQVADPSKGQKNVTFNTQDNYSQLLFVLSCPLCHPLIAQMSQVALQFFFSWRTLKSHNFFFEDFEDMFVDFWEHLDIPIIC